MCDSSLHTKYQNKSNRAVALSIYLMKTNPGNLVIVVIILECVITAVECLIYSVALVNKEGKKDCKRSIAYGVVANLLSALTMLIH